MGNPLIVMPLLSDAAALTTAATVAASMPLSNLQVMQPSDKTRFKNLSETIAFKVDLTAAMTATGITSWNFVGLFYTNLDADAEWRIVGASSEGGLSSPTYDTRVSGNDLVFWPSPDLKPTWERVHGWVFVSGAARTETWLQVTIFNADNADGFIDLGRLYVGLAYQPTLPRKFGEMPDDVEEERSVLSEGGQEYTRSDGPRTVFPMVLQVDGEGALEELMVNIRRIKRLRGTSKDIFVIDDPEEATYAMEKCCYGKMTGAQPTQVPGHQSYEVAITVRELR